MGVIETRNAIRHLQEHLQKARKKSGNRRAAIKDLINRNQWLWAELRAAWNTLKARGEGMKWVKLTKDNMPPAKKRVLFYSETEGPFVGEISQDGKMIFADIFIFMGKNEDGAAFYTESCDVNHWCKIEEPEEKG